MRGESYWLKLYLLQTACAGPKSAWTVYDIRSQKRDWLGCCWKQIYSSVIFSGNNVCGFNHAVELFILFTFCGKNFSM